LIETVRRFCVRRDVDDWKRCLACGICWVPDGIAACNRQFSVLIDKCKLSIDGSLQKMGYWALQTGFETGTAVTAAIPMLRRKRSELREWTVRAATPPPDTIYSIPVVVPVE
jgi:hypothetical protein